MTWRRMRDILACPLWCRYPPALSLNWVALPILNAHFLLGMLNELATERVWVKLIVTCNYMRHYWMEFTLASSFVVFQISSLCLQYAMTHLISWTTFGGTTLDPFMFSAKIYISSELVVSCSVLFFLLENKSDYFHLLSVQIFKST